MNTQLLTMWSLIADRLNFRMLHLEKRWYCWEKLDFQGLGTKKQTSDWEIILFLNDRLSCVGFACGQEPNLLSKWYNALMKYYR